MLHTVEFGNHKTGYFFLQILKSGYAKWMLINKGGYDATIWVARPVILWSKLPPPRTEGYKPIASRTRAIKTAKILAKKASRRGKMLYVTKLINNVNKQVSENGETRQVDFNIHSLKKAMTNFRDFNDEYVENLEDSDEIDGFFTTLLTTEDKFQQCIEAADHT